MKLSSEAVKSVTKSPNFVGPKGVVAGKVPKPQQPKWTPVKELARETSKLSHGLGYALVKANAGILEEGVEFTKENPEAQQELKGLQLAGETSAPESTSEALYQEMQPERSEGKEPEPGKNTGPEDDSGHNSDSSYGTMPKLCARRSDDSSLEGSLILDPDTDEETLPSLLDPKSSSEESDGVKPSSAVQRWGDEDSSSNSDLNGRLESDGVKTPRIMKEDQLKSLNKFVFFTSY